MWCDLPHIRVGAGNNLHQLSDVLDVLLAHPLYLVCPDLPCAVGETSYGIWVGFIGSTHSLYCMYVCMYLYLRCKKYSYPVKQTKIIFSQQKRKQPSLPSRNNNLCFYQLTTLYSTSLTRLCYSTASVSHPIPLSAANPFSRFKLSVCNPSPLSPTISWMYHDS